MLAQGPPAGLDPANLPIGVHDAVLRLELTAGRDRMLEGVVDPRKVVGVDALVERLDGATERVLVEPEQLEQPSVPAQAVGHEVPDERADAGRIHGQPPRDAVAGGVEGVEDDARIRVSGFPAPGHGEVHLDVILGH